MRQPMEDKIVTISRAKGSLTFSANFQLIAAMNPCPCGFYGDSQKACTCAPAVVTKYQKRISGPILDRIDIHIEVPRVDYEKLSGDRLGETSASIRNECKPHEIFNTHDSRIPIPQITMSFATQTCASGRSGNFASCSPKVRA
jgi:predicted ATPase with chaperone activity